MKQVKTKLDLVLLSMYILWALFPCVVFAKANYISVNSKQENSQKIYLRESDLSHNLSDGEFDLRLYFDARQLLKEQNFPQDLKLEIYTIKDGEKQFLIQANKSINSLKQAKQVFYQVTLPRLESSAELEFDLYDSSKELHSSFVKEVSVNSNQAQSNLSSLPSMNCTGTDGDCLLEYIFDHVTFSVGAGEKFQSLVEKKDQGSYVVNIPVKYSKTKTRGSKKKSTVSGAGQISGFRNRKGYPFFENKIEVARALWEELSEGVRVAFENTQNFFRFNSDGSLQLSTDFNNAYLNIAAGTKTKAPILFTEGELLDQPVAGSLEYDGENLYLTNNFKRKLLGEVGPAGPVGPPGPQGPAGPPGNDGVGGGSGVDLSNGGVLNGTVQFINYAVLEDAQLNGNLIYNVGAQNGYVLSSDANGYASWQSITSIANGLTINGASSSGTAGAIQFSDGSGGFSANGTNFYYNDTSDYAVIGTASLNETAIGFEAAFNNTGTSVVAIGERAARYNHGDYVYVIGERAAEDSNGNNMVALGYLAAENSIGDDIYAIGTSAGRNFNGNDLTAVGDQAGTSATGQFITALGNRAAANANTSYAQAMGYLSARYTDGQHLNAFGRSAGYFNNGDHVNTLGYFSAENNNGDYVNALGRSSAGDNTGDYVDAIGSYAAQENTGAHVQAVGFTAARYNKASNVVAIGNSAASANDGIGVIALGRDTLSQNNGDYNVAIGYQVATLLNNGAQNIFIGNQVEAQDNNGSYELNIGDTIYGDLNNGEIALGAATDNPQATLDLTGSFRYIDGSQANGFVLVSNGGGFASWQSLGQTLNGSSYSASGSAGRIQFSDGASRFSSDNTFFYDATNNGLAVNSTSTGTRALYILQTVDGSGKGITLASQADTGNQIDLNADNADHSSILIQTNNALRNAAIGFRNSADNEVWRMGLGVSGDFSLGLGYPNSGGISASDALMSLDENGRVQFGTAVMPNDRKMTVLLEQNDEEGLVVVGANGQTANLQEWQDDNGLILTQIRSDGDIQFHEDKGIYFKRAGVVEYGYIGHDGNDMTISAGNWAGTDIEMQAQGEVEVNAPMLRLENASVVLSGGSSGSSSITMRANNGLIFDSGYGGGAASFAVQNSGVEVMVVNGSGSLGLGISAPTEKLHVNGDGLFKGSNYSLRIQDAGASGHHIVSTSSGVHATFLPSNNTYFYQNVIFNQGQGTTRDFAIYGDINADFVFADVSTERLGIGTAAPQRKVHISEAMRLEPQSSPPASPSMGDLYVDSDSGELCFYDGTSWTGMKAGGACI